MNANFVFPAQPSAPTPRPPPARKQEESAPRDSSALRASVLDAALELGIGSNSLVTDWMFNNAVDEEDENEEQITPDVLDASSSISSSSQTHIKPEVEEGATSNGLRVFPEAAGADDAFHPVMFRTGLFPGQGTGQPVVFPDVTLLSPEIQSVPTTPAPSLYWSGTKKLKKVKKGIADDYDSDGGYFIEGVTKKKDKKKWKSKDGDSTVDGNATQNGGLMVPEERKRKKSIVDVVRASTKKKKAKETDGYATDGASMKIRKAKPKSKDKDTMDASSYETDGGSKKSKTRSFFGLSSKSSKPDFSKDNDIPAVPSLKEARPLPIAQRFTTTANSQNGSESPVDDHERPRSLAVSLPSAISSKSTVNEIPPSTSDGALPSLSFQPFGTTTDMEAMSTFSRSESPPPPAPAAQPPTQQNSVPPVSFAHTHRTGAVRDSQASSGSSSSGASHPRSLNSAGTLSPSMSSLVTSPATSYSHFQIPSPRLGLGVASGSTTTGVPQQNSVQGYGFVPKTDGLSTTGWPKRMSSSKLPSSPAVGIPPGMKPMTFQIARDISTVPLMKQQQQTEPEPQADDRPPSRIQPVGNDEVAKPPKRLSSLPSIVPLNIGKGGGLKPSLLGLRKEDKEHAAIGRAPSPISTPSEFTTSWKFPPSAAQYDPPHSPMHPLSPGRSRNGRPMSPPDKPSPTTQSLSPHAFISPPNTATTSSTPPASATSRLRPSVNMTLSPRSIAPPNVLAYYDIPPPSPPPMGPLPVPPQMNGDGNITTKRSPSPLPLRNRSRSPIPPPSVHSGPDVSQLPNPAQLRQRMLDRTPRPLAVDDTTRGPGAFGRGAGTPFNSNIKRGRESPFPSGPLFVRPLVPLNSSVSDESGEGTKKFRDPSPQPSTAGHPASVNHWDSKVPNSIRNSKTVEKRISWVDFKDMLGKSIDDRSEDEPQVNFSQGEGMRGSLDSNRSVSSEGSDIRSILERFTSDPHGSEESVHSEKPLVRSGSSEAPNSTNTNPPRSRFAWDDAATVGDRTSRWSGSIYSRMSIMDEDESNAARDRFVERVEAMLAAEEKRKNGGGVEGDNDRDPATEGIGNGLGRRGSRGTRGTGTDGYIPPVPKIPEVFANTTLRSDARLTWNKF